MTKDTITYYTDIQKIDIDKITPNPWNPNAMDEGQLAKLKEWIKTKGFRIPVPARDMDNGTFQILDGEQRWSQLKELGGQHIVIANQGVMTDAEAKIFTLQFRSRGEEDSLKLSEIINDLKIDLDMDAILAELPFSQEDIDNLLALQDFDWSQYDSNDKDEDTDQGDKWVDMQFRVPQDCVDIINSEIDRLLDIMGMDKKTPENVRRGLALEKMAVLSAETPTESLT